MNKSTRVQSRRAAILLFVLVATTTIPMAHAEWTRFGGANGDFKETSSHGKTFSGLRLGWSAQIGEGLSSIVCSQEYAFASYLSGDAKSEGVAALQRSDGAIAWKHEWPVDQLKDQEAFGGRPRAPQATPLLHDGKLVVIGFTGILHCLDQKTGAVDWKKSLVDEFAAVPVQFGFSASPMIHDGLLIVLAGGKNGGLVAMDLKTGETRWNSPCKEASYATPVALNINDTEQIVFVTRMDVIGVDATTGDELWRYQQPNPGMTNVPTPLVAGDDRIVVSGQGFNGTRELVIRQEADESWTVEEGWKQRVQFFYCNWLLDDGLIIGCNGDLLMAIDSKTGKRLGRWRGYTDCNVVRTGDQLLIVDGSGKLSIAEISVEGISIAAKYEVLKERCWAPPTVDGNQLWLRGGKQLVCLMLEYASSDESPIDLTRVPVVKATLPIKAASQDDSAASAMEDEDRSFVEQIVTTFQSDGPEAAWKRYSTIRTVDGKSFSLDDRLELAELAQGQGLADFGMQILKHAQEDFDDKNSAATINKLLRNLELATEPQDKKVTGKNGLVYIELGIKNRSFKFLNALVRGPKRHPFSYGIPFSPGKERIEKWPIGTKLYVDESESPEALLFTVKESDAGKTIEIPNVKRK